MNCFRSTIGLDHVNSLILLSVKNSMLKSLNFDEIYDFFARIIVTYVLGPTCGPPCPTGGQPGPTGGPPLKNIFPCLAHQFWAPSIYSPTCAAQIFAGKTFPVEFFPLSVLFNEKQLVCLAL